MKRKNLRNTIISTVIAIAILAAVALAAVLLINAILPDPAPDPVPNAGFGMVEAVYHPYTETPITDLEGDTDVVTIDAILPNYSDDVYYEFAPTSERRYTGFFGLSREYKEDEDALTLHLRATVHVERKLVQTAQRYRYGDLLPAVSETEYAYHEGFIEKRDESGEWVRVGRIEPERGEEFVSEYGRVILNTLTCGRNYIETDFPLHDPGEYRITYKFRKLDSIPFSHITTGDELYVVSHTVTIPEASGEKFDVVAVDVEHSGGVARVAALIRSNDGTIPMQYLTKTKLEKFDGGEWVDSSDKLTELYEIVGSNDYSALADVQYEAYHPFSGEAIENLFCGVAEFEAYDGYDADVLYRLTLEFIDGYETDAARYALQLDLDLS